MHEQSEHVETMDFLLLLVTCSSMHNHYPCAHGAGLDCKLHVAIDDGCNSSDTSGVFAGARKDTEGIRNHQRDTLA